MSFRLCEDRIFVKAEEEDDRTKSGLIVTSDSAKEPMRYGTVAVVGIGHRSDRGVLIPIDVNVGDRVFFSRGSGSKITIDDEDYVCLASREIVGIVDVT